MYLIAKKKKPVNVLTNNNNNHRQKALSNILKAYSIYNSEVGYCQGMADIAALLVMYMEEEVQFLVPSFLVLMLLFNPV